ncbi:MAG: hypothetical protein Q7U54_11930 [Bacteroidales bacterium]|jgi:hypothetical protein|nr:hypothetical protein [Bacteroidales bacterium]
MLKGVLLQTTHGIVDEINAVLYPSVALSQLNPSIFYGKGFICQIQRKQAHCPKIINCT